MYYRLLSEPRSITPPPPRVLGESALGHVSLSVLGHPPTYSQHQNQREQQLQQLYLTQHPGLKIEHHRNEYGRSGGNRGEVHHPGMEPVITNRAPKVGHDPYTQRGVYE